ncbi:MAG: HAMP domain-containing protein, partial [Sulfuricella sp.]|nr:HAMP domain-containing protein [Sulfuricella sp.]
MKYVLTLCIGLGAVTLYLLSNASANAAAFSQYYTLLLGLNGALAACLLALVLYQLWNLRRKLKARVFGSKLTLRLLLMFVLMAVLPGVLVYGVSVQFLSKSIETWFDVRVESALEAGLNLGRSTIDTLGQDLGNKTRLAAERLSGSPNAGVETSFTPGVLDLERVREQLGAQSVALISETGQLQIGAGSESLPLMSAERVPLSMRQDARNKGVVSLIEGLEEKGDPAASPPINSVNNDARIVALAWMPDRSFSLQTKGHYLMVTQKLRADLVKNALDVQNAYREYQQRSLGREGLRRMYIGTLTLALILAVFGAFLLAAILGQQLAHPLLLLAEGVDKVAKGDLSPKAIFASHDELGGLTRSFAAMTQQLSDARILAQRSVAELDSARGHLQTILDNLTAGVIVFDQHGNIDTVNPGATRILRLPLSAYRGRPLSDVPGLETFAAALNERFELYASDPTPGERQQWQESYELQLNPQHEAQTLLVRGADLPPDANLIVFDDITEVVSAQRAEAWAEVARRVAHEIKNPLTPIQLSA